MKFAKSLLVALLLFGAITLPACCKKKNGQRKEHHTKKHQAKKHTAHKSKSMKKCDKYKKCASDCK